MLKEAKEETAHDFQGPIGAASVSPDSILPKFLNVFKCTPIKWLNIEMKILRLIMEGSNYPVSVCGDSCITNLAARRKLEEKHGTKFPFSNCSSHVVSGNIRTTAISETMCNENVTRLHNCLIKVLKHFSKSPKRKEILTKALLALELNNSHMLAWGSIRIGRFIDGCKHCSDILVPFKDTLVTGNIISEETPFLLSPMRIFLLQLMD